MFVFKPVMPTLVVGFCGVGFFVFFFEGHVYVDFNEPETEPTGENVMVFIF